MYHVCVEIKCLLCKYFPLLCTQQLYKAHLNFSIMEFINMHVPVLCIAIFRSRGELTVLNILALKGICVLPLLYSFMS